MAKKTANGEVVEVPLKMKNAYRTLPLAEDTVSVLKEQRRKGDGSTVRKSKRFTHVRQMELATDNTPKTIASWFFELSEIGCCGLMRG